MTRTSASIGIGIIGCGSIGQVHATAYQQLAREGHAVRVLGVADANPHHAMRFAQEFGIEFCHTDVSALLERSDIDAVSICTPNPSHREHAVDAASAGMHVMLEKPIALSLDDADAIIEACRAAGVLLMVGQSARFERMNRELRLLIEGGEIGRPIYVGTAAYYGYFWPGAWRAWQIRREQSGGNLVHNGVHDVDLLCWLMQSAPQRLLARGLKIASPHLETFDHYHVHLVFADGAAALARLSYSAIPREFFMRSAYVLGDRGEARFDSSKDGVVWRDGSPVVAPTTGESAHYEELKHWLECVRDGREPLITAGQARLALELALAAEESASTGNVITFEERRYA